MTPPPTHMPRLHAVTTAIDPIDDPLEHADPRQPLVWARRGDLLVGYGETLRLAVTETTASDTWSALTAHAVIDDHVRRAGTGLIAFGALPFDQESPAGGILVIPAVVWGRRDGVSWITRITAEDEDALGDDEPPRTTFGPHWAATYGPGALTPDGYQNAVREAIGQIDGGRVSKIVLARDLVGSVPAGSDLRRLVRALASAYPDTWTFAVDGLIGASPETLITVSAGTVTARVLAGTAARGADPDADTAAAVALATSPKDLDEHQYAVQSVLAALRPHVSALAAMEQPFTLKLPNVWHLATDVEGELTERASSLDLVAALHPTAAVAGTPTDIALDLIRLLEPFDRGRYAGPVGWIDADGNGEWAIALRCAQFAAPRADESEISFSAHAGAGIVSASDPESEMLETRVKFRPIVDALA